MLTFSVARVDVLRCFCVGEGKYACGCKGHTIPGEREATYRTYSSLE